jgi:hypothetical protein
VGTIARRAGCPVDEDQWEWGCGFYPGMDPGQDQNGTAADFDHARADVEAAWRRLLPTLTETSFQEWRHQRNFTAWKYAMWETGKKLPTQLPGGRSRCYCGASIDIASARGHVRSAHSSSVEA